MSLMPQIKGTFIKMECFKTKPCPSRKKMTRVDEGLTPTKDEGTCLRRLSMFRKEVH